MNTDDFRSSPLVEDRRGSGARPNLLVEHGLFDLIQDPRIPDEEKKRIVLEFNARRPYDPDNPLFSGHYQGLPNNPIAFGFSPSDRSAQNEPSVGDRMRTQGLYDSLSDLLKGGVVQNFGIGSR